MRIGTWRARPATVLGALALTTLWITLQACGSQALDASGLPGEVPGPGGPDTGALCTTDSCPVGEVCLQGRCRPEGTCIDNDGDGFGDGCPAGEDCDDDDAGIFPGALEVCDGRDNNCDFRVDEGGVCTPCVPECVPGERRCGGVGPIFCSDASGCAVFTSPVPCPAGTACRQGTCELLCVDADGDGVGVDCPDLVVEDCDDNDPTVYPGAVEICDGKDNNCDGRIDENFVCDAECEDECWVEGEACEGETGVLSCVRAPSGCLARRFGRCPGGERCQGGACIPAPPVCDDRDGDGAGPACAEVRDCRPLDASSHPAAVEVCDGLDNDCDGVVDNGGVCVGCRSAPASAPASVGPQGAVYRVHCGGTDHLRLIPPPGATAAWVVLGSGTTAATLGAGTVQGGTFTQRVASDALGTFRQLSLPNPTADTVLQVTAPAGTAYALAVGYDTPTCRDAGWEPDNSPQSAGLTGPAPFAVGADLCLGDSDFYAIEAPAGAVLSVAMASASSFAPPVVTLWYNGLEVTPSFSDLANDDGTLRGRRSHIRLDLPGTWTVGVRNLAPQRINGYALVTQVTLPPRCDDDRWERPGGVDNDTLGTATPWPGGSVDARLCPGDYDYWRLGRLEAGGNLSGAFVPDNPDLEVRVLRNNWGGIRDFPTGISSGGEYWLVVYGRTPEATGAYTLRVDPR
jgi:hypothetical protein